MLKNKMIYLMYEYNNQSVLKKMLKEDPSLSFVSQKDALNTIKSMKCRAITILDREYPDGLKLLDDPPWVIFYYGNISIFNENELCMIIGNKSPSYYSLKVTDDFLNENIGTDNYVSIAGNIFAKKTIEINNQYQKPNLLVTPYGFDFEVNNTYAKLKKDDLMISFFSPKAVPSKEVYIQTLIYAVCMCKKLYVMELKKNSLLFEVIDIAIHLDIKVIVLPGNVYDSRVSGNNYLLNEGAELLYLKGV